MATNTNEITKKVLALVFSGTHPTKAIELVCHKLNITLSEQEREVIVHNVSRTIYRAGSN